MVSKYLLYYWLPKVIFDIMHGQILKNSYGIIHGRLTSFCACACICLGGQELEIPSLYFSFNNWFRVLIKEE